MNDGKKTVQQFIYGIFCRIKFGIMLHAKDLNTCIYKEGAEDIEDPFKILNEHNTYGNKNDPENDRHQNSNEKSSCYMIATDLEKSKNEDEHENIVNAQAP